MNHKSIHFVILTLCYIYNLSTCISETGISTKPKSIHTEFQYEVKINNIPESTRQLKLWIPIPSNDHWQKVDSLNISGMRNYKITRESKYGNRMIFIQTHSPENQIYLKIKYNVIRKPVTVLQYGLYKKKINSQINKISNPKIWLQPDEHVPVGGEYLEMAKEIIGNRKDTIAQVQALYDYVIQTMQYDYKKESPRLGEGDVPFVCNYKKGNCSDLHSCLISFARSLGIPAYLEYGFPITGIPFSNPFPKEGTIGGYHCWTWFYDKEKGWIPLDASDGRRWLDSNQPDKKEYLFGNLILERSAIVVTRGRDITLQPPQQSGPLNYFIYPYAEMDGQPMDVDYQVRYHVISKD